MAGTKTLPHAAQQVLKPRRDAPDRLVNTPDKDLVSFSVFSSVPETLGTEYVKAHGLPGWSSPWGFTHCY